MRTFEQTEKNGLLLSAAFVLLLFCFFLLNPIKQKCGGSNNDEYWWFVGGEMVAANFSLLVEHPMNVCPSHAASREDESLSSLGTIFHSWLMIFRFRCFSLPLAFLSSCTSVIFHRLFILLCIFYYTSFPCVTARREHRVEQILRCSVLSSE